MSDLSKISVSPAGRKALVSARDRGSATAHLSGMSEWGGWGGTRAALQRRGLLDNICRITPLGLDVINFLEPKRKSAS